jgi:hypothetical protein
VDWSVNLTVSQDRKSLIANILYHAVEWENGRRRKDLTEACGSWSQTVYTCIPEEMILQIIDDSSDKGSYVDTDHSTDKATGNLYQQYLLNGDGVNNDVGVNTTIQAPIPGNAKIQIVASQ